MVYSSDFYTSRRPAYYKPGSSYSVTPLFSSDGYELPPTYYKAHQVYQTCTTPTPFILTPAISTGKPSPNVLPYHGNPYFHHQYVPLHRRSAATIHGVLDRIEHRQRSHPSYDPTDEYLNSKSAVTFDDVTRDIRAQTAGLLKKVYTPTYRPKMSSVSNGYSELPVTQRIESDAYIEKILSDSESYRRDNNIGKGHLACVSYAGGKAYPRRRPHLSKEVDDNITMLSYYNKTREAAAAPTTHSKVKINGTQTPTFNHHEERSEQNENKIQLNTTEPTKRVLAKKVVIKEEEPLTDERVDNSRQLVDEISPDTKFEESKPQTDSSEKKTEDTVVAKHQKHNSFEIEDSSTATNEIINEEEKNEEPLNVAESAQNILAENEITTAEEKVNPSNYLTDEENVGETQKSNETLPEKETEDCEQTDLSENKTEDIISERQNDNTSEIADSSVTAELVDEGEEEKILATEKEVKYEEKEEENLEEIEDSEEAEETKSVINEINTEGVECQRQDGFEFENSSITATNEINDEEEKVTNEKEGGEEEETKNEKLSSSNYLTAEEAVSSTEQLTDSNEKETRDVESEFQKHNSAAISESSTTTTEVTNSDDGVQTTAIFQRTVKKTTTITSSTTVTSAGDDDNDINTTVEIQEVIEEDNENDKLHHNTENKDSARAEEHESSGEEDESEEDEEESGEE